MSAPQRNRRARSGRLRTVLASFGLVILVPVGATLAAYSDDAAVGLASSGIGSAERFDIGLVSQDTVLQADGPDGAPWAIDGAEKLVPGRTITTAVPVFNNTPRLLAETTFAIAARNGDGRVSDTVPNITPFLRFSATLPDGSVLFEQAELADASGAIGVLAARGAASLDEGDPFDPGASGSLATIPLSIEYLDLPGTEALNGGQSALALRLDASSAAP